MSYIHGTSPDEQRRLSLMNDLLNAGSFRELAPSPGDRVLDLGTGLGQLARMTARAVGPAGRVVGIESSAEQIVGAEAQAAQEGLPGLVELRQGDAANPPLADDEWGAFDIVHTRFLLEHLRDPAAVVRTMVRAARPGGRIVLEDDDHDLLRLWPDPGPFGRVWEAYQETYRRSGCDPLLGRRLPQLLHEAGAAPSRMTWIFFGACAGEAMFPVAIANLLGIMTGARDAILATRTIDVPEFDSGIEAVRRFASSPGASFGYAIAWAEGRRPNS